MYKVIGYQLSFIHMYLKIVLTTHCKFTRFLFTLVSVITRNGHYIWQVSAMHTYVSFFFVKSQCSLLDFCHLTIFCWNHELYQQFCIRRLSFFLEAEQILERSRLSTDSNYLAKILSIILNTLPHTLAP